MADNFKIKRKGDRDNTPLIRFIMMFLTVVVSLMTISIMTRAFGGATPFTFKYVVIFALCSIPLCVLGTYAIGRLGSGFGRLLSGRISAPPDKEGAFLCDIHKVEHSKRQGDFEQALLMVDDLLQKAPDYPEALYLKARILWEGFEDAASARACLVRVRELTPEESQFHPWANGYLETLPKKESIALHSCLIPCLALYS